MPNFSTKTRRWFISLLEDTEDDIQDELNEDLIPKELLVPLPDPNDMDVDAWKIRNNDLHHQAILINGMAEALNSMNRHFGIRTGRLEAKMGLLLALSIGMVMSLSGAALKLVLVPMLLGG